MVPLRDAVIPLLVSITGTIIIFSITLFFSKDLVLSSLITSLLLMFFYSYGHVYGGLLHPQTGAYAAKLGLIGNHKLLASVWVVLLVSAVVIIIRLSSHKIVLSQLFSIIGLLTISFPLANIIQYQYHLLTPRKETKALDNFNSSGKSSNLQSLPDIYYIILDGYGQSEILLDYYGYDNSEFIDFLRINGFFVAENSQSNYVQTSLSISSSLNYDYIDKLIFPGEKTQKEIVLAKLIRWNKVADQLTRIGYKTIAFSTGYRVTELDNSDDFINASIFSGTVFDRLLLETSAFVISNELFPKLGLPKLYPGYATHRNRVNSTFDKLGEISNSTKPKFVFVHIISPHPPFVFDVYGEAIEPTAPFYFLDGSAYIGSREEYKDGYRDQIQYINSRVEKLISRILKDSTEKPIIIIQGDHGPGSTFNWDQPDEIGLNERTGILNAYYLGSFDDNLLYNEISPVNTFRVIFNTIFDTEFPILDDHSYYSSWSEPFIFKDVDLYRSEY